MAKYPEDCFTKLLGVRGVCEPKGDVVYYLDDIPGFDLGGLSDVATPDAPAGKTMADKVIESASRLVMADLVTAYNGNYKVENTLVEGCSTAVFLPSYGGGHQRGILMRDHTHSAFASLQLDVLRAKLNADGLFHIVLDDGDPANQVVIEHQFAAGREYEFKGIGYTTKQRRVEIYLEEDDVPLAKLRMPRSGSGCSCSGKRNVVEALTYTGLDDGAESATGYGFIPCGFVKCNPDHLLCWLANSAPRMVGMALLFKAASLYFTQAAYSTRNNRTAGLSVDDKKEQAKAYEASYQSKLLGKGTRGLNDLISTSLGQVKDPCVVCDALLSVAWARS